VTAETAKAVSDLNAIIDGPIKKINEKLQGRPHVMTGSPVR
jgi:glycine cleavage system H lipoate-binding protein